MAGAAPDEHHLLAEDVPLGTVELHLGGDGGDRRAAATVGAQTAKLGLVEAHAVAAGQLEAHALLGLGRPHTLFSLLDLLLLLCATGPDHADAWLPLQLAALIVIGDTR